MFSNVVGSTTLKSESVSISTAKGPAGFLISTTMESDNIVGSSNLDSSTAISSTIAETDGLVTSTMVESLPTVSAVIWTGYNTTFLSIDIFSKKNTVTKNSKIPQHSIDGEQFVIIHFIAIGGGFLVALLIFILFRKVKI